MLDTSGKRRNLLPSPKEALAELNRRSKLGDPLKDFKPTLKQSEFIQAVISGQYDECYLMAANRFGKTLVGAYLGSAIARCVKWTGFSHPTAGWVVSLDFNLSQQSTQPYYFDNGYGVGIRPFIPDHEIEKFDRQAQTLFLKIGSLIAFKSCDSGPLKFQAAGKHWIHKDEAPPKIIDDEMAIRITAGARLLQFTTCTLLPPEGRAGSVHWLYNDVVKPWKAGYRKRWITNGSIYDNPHLLPEEITRLEARYPEGSTIRRIRLGGELLPGIAGTLVYKMLRGIHVRECELDPDYPVIWSWDFNICPLVSLVLQKREGKLWCLYELWMDEGSIPEMCAMFRAIVSTSYRVRLEGDATAGRSPQTRQTSYQIIMSEMVSHGYQITMNVPAANPAVTDRINHVNIALANHEEKATMFISPRCERLLTDLESVIYDSNNTIKKVNNPTDPYSKLTHLSDAAGYAVCQELPITDVRPVNYNPFTIREASYRRRA